MNDDAFFDLGEGLLVSSDGELVDCELAIHTRAALVAQRLYYASEEYDAWGAVVGALKAALRRLQERGTTNYGETAVTISPNSRRSVDSVVLRSLLEQLEADRTTLLSLIEQATFPLSVAETVLPLMEGAELPAFVGELTTTKFYQDKVTARPVRVAAPRKQQKEEVLA